MRQIAAVPILRIWDRRRARRILEQDPHATVKRVYRWLDRLQAYQLEYMGRPLHGLAELYEVSLT